MTPQFVTLGYVSLKQAKQIRQALDAAWERAYWLDSDMPRGFKWEQQAIERLRDEINKGIAVGEANVAGAATRQRPAPDITEVTRMLTERTCSIEICARRQHQADPFGV
jgi:hypothetical protein